MLDKLFCLGTDFSQFPSLWICSLTYTLWVSHALPKQWTVSLYYIWNNQAPLLAPSRRVGYLQIFNAPSLNPTPLCTDSLTNWQLSNSNCLWRSIWPSLCVTWAPNNLLLAWAALEGIMRREMKQDQVAMRHLPGVVCLKQSLWKEINLSGQTTNSSKDSDQGLMIASVNLMRAYLSGTVR